MVKSVLQLPGNICARGAQSFDYHIIVVMNQMGNCYLVVAIPLSPAQRIASGCRVNEKGNKKECLFEASP